jgi:hypothetical protein
MSTATTAYADTEAEYNKAVEQIPVPFERVEKALEKQGSGPFFQVGLEVYRAGESCRGVIPIAATL